MENNRRYCPLMSAQYNSGMRYCQEHLCAWWSEENRACAVLAQLRKKADGKNG